MAEVNTHMFRYSPKTQTQTSKAGSWRFDRSTIQPQPINITEMVLIAVRARYILNVLFANLGAHVVAEPRSKH